MGEPPAVELTVTNLNDNVDKNFLSDMFQRANFQWDEISIYHHPETNRHLGVARVILKSSKQMRACIEKFNSKSVMGKIITVFHDQYGERCRNLVEELTTEKKQPPPVPAPIPHQPALSFSIPEPHLPPVVENAVAAAAVSEEPSYWSTSKKYNKSEDDWDNSNSYGSSSYRNKYEDDYRSSKYDKYDRGKDRNSSRYHRDDHERDRHRRDRDRRDYRRDDHRERSRKERDRDYYEYSRSEKYDRYERGSERGSKSYSRHSSSSSADYHGYYPNNYPPYPSSSSWVPPPLPDRGGPTPPPPEPDNNSCPGKL